MCNCNQKRTMYSNQNVVQKGMTKVKLIKNEPVVLSGNITGRMYVFRNINDLISMDTRDVMSMKKIDGLQIMF